MCTGCIVCCPLVSHVEYALHTLLRSEITGQTDGRQTETLCLLQDAANIIICSSVITHASIAAGVGIVFRHVCLYVCLFAL